MKKYYNHCRHTKATLTSPGRTEHVLLEECCPPPNLQTAQSAIVVSCNNCSLVSMNYYHHRGRRCIQRVFTFQLSITVGTSPKTCSAFYSRLHVVQVVGMQPEFQAPYSTIPTGCAASGFAQITTPQLQEIYHHPGNLKVSNIDPQPTQWSTPE